MLLVKVLIKFHKVLKESEMFYFEDVYYDSSYVLQSSLVPNKEKICHNLLLLYNQQAFIF